MGAQTSAQDAHPLLFGEDALPLVGVVENVFTFFQYSAIMAVVTETNVNGREKRYAEYAYLRGAHQSLSRPISGAF